MIKEELIDFVQSAWGSADVIEIRPVHDGVEIITYDVDAAPDARTRLCNRTVGYLIGDFDIDEVLYVGTTGIKTVVDLVKEWDQKQGHDKCHYYPEIFGAIASKLGIVLKNDPLNVTEAEFRQGCDQYTKELFHGQANQTNRLGEPGPAQADSCNLESATDTRAGNSGKQTGDWDGSFWPDI